jgi:hypothetical protein
MPTTKARYLTIEAPDTKATVDFLSAQARVDIELDGTVLTIETYDRTGARKVLVIHLEPPQTDEENT